MLLSDVRRGALIAALVLKLLTLLMLESGS